MAKTRLGARVRKEFGADTYPALVLAMRWMDKPHHHRAAPQTSPSQQEEAVMRLVARLVVKANLESKSKQPTTN